MTGRVVHFEIPCDDRERAEAFYREAFGWRMTSLPDTGYTLAETGPSEGSWPSETGYVNGGLIRREDPREGPIVVIEVDDIDAALARVTALGGKVLLGSHMMGDHGWTAYIKDVEGNSVGLFQPA
ncbi:VOC family protein [Nocardioides pacificus]